LEYNLNADPVGCKEKHFCVIKLVMSYCCIGGTLAECVWTVYCMLCDDTASVMLIVVNRVIRG
jgi:hypothetical protein